MNEYLLLLLIFIVFFSFIVIGFKNKIGRFLNKQKKIIKYIYAAFLLFFLPILLTIIVMVVARSPFIMSQSPLILLLILYVSVYIIYKITDTRDES